MLAVMDLEGIQVARPDVLELADRLVLANQDEIASLLLIADAAGDPRVDLTIADREHVLAVLVDPPDGLLELRAALLAEHVARTRGDMA